MVVDDVDWNQRYSTSDTPWDSSRPSLELKRILRSRKIPAGRMLEIGCGTGTNAVFLARQGFQVTALDVSLLAIEKARARAKKSGVKIRFLQGSVLEPPDLGRTFPFVFDRGVYHHLRKVDLRGYLAALERVTRAGSLYLTLAGNSNEPSGPEGGPPTVGASELSAELEPLFDLVELREFRFDGVVAAGKPLSPLGWSALLRRKKIR